MKLRALRPGDRVEVSIRGRVFPARYQGRDLERYGPHRVAIVPPRGFSFMSCTPAQIKRKLPDGPGKQLQLVNVGVARALDRVDA